MVKNKTLYFTF